LARHAGPGRGGDLAARGAPRRGHRAHARGAPPGRGGAGARRRVGGAAARRRRVRARRSRRFTVAGGARARGRGAPRLAHQRHVRRGGARLRSGGRDGARVVGASTHAANGTVRRIEVGLKFADMTPNMRWTALAAVCLVAAVGIVIALYGSHAALLTPVFIVAIGGGVPALIASYAMVQRVEAAESNAGE